MQTTIERPNSATVKLIIEASADEVAPALKRAVAVLGRKVKVPGFRPGHVPRKVLEGRVGLDALKDQVVQQAIPELLGKAIEGEDIDALSQPRVQVTSYELDAALVFEATIDVKPEVPEPNYELLHVDVPPTDATDEEISEQLARIQDRFATLEPADRAAARGDLVRIDLTTAIGDVKPAELQGTDQLYQVGSGGLVPDLDDHLQNAKPGDVLAFEATLPEELGGQQASITVLVKEVNRKIVPELDDGFASDASEFETLDELTADVRGQLERVKKVQAASLVRQTLLEQAVNDTEFAIPESMTVREMAAQLERFEQQLRMNGTTIDAYLEQSGITEEQIEGDLRTQAEGRVRATLLLESIAQRNDVKITDDELKAEVAYHAQTMRLDPEQAKQFFSDRDRILQVAGDIIRRKALDLLVERAGYGNEAAVDAAPADDGDASVDQKEDA